MQRFYAAVNVTDLMYLMTARTLSLNHETEFMKDLPHTLDGVRESSNEIGFTHVVAQVDRLKHWIAQGADAKTLGILVQELIGSIQAAYVKKLFFFVPEADQPFYESVMLSQKALDSFPSLCFDITEAGKCFSLDRHTACVFHLMRAVEVGLDALVKALAFTPSSPNWEIILNECEREIRGLHKKAAILPTWKEDEHFYSEAALQFRHFKNALRNYTMHKHEKYTREEAIGIFNSVRAFLDHIADRLTE